MLSVLCPITQNSGVNQTFKHWSQSLDILLTFSFHDCTLIKMDPIDWSWLLYLVMCWLGLKVGGQAKPDSIGRAKAKPRAWLLLALGSGFGFSKPRTLAQAMAFGWIFWASPDIFSGGCELTKPSKHLRQWVSETECLSHPYNHELILIPLSSSCFRPLITAQLAH